MISKLRERKKTVIGLVILSLFVDGFCMAYLFSFYKSGLKRSQTQQRLVASASPVEGIDTSNTDANSTPTPVEGEPLIHTTPEIEPLYYKSSPATESQIEPIEPLMTSEPTSVPEPVSIPVPLPAPMPPAQNANPSYASPPATKREEEMSPQSGLPTPFPTPRKDSEKELEALERANQLHSPQEAISLQTSTTEKGLSPFIAWPQFQFEVGPGSGRDSFQSVIGPFSLNNSNLVSGMGYFLRAQTSITPRLVTEAKYVSSYGNISNPGNTVIDQSFQTDEATLSARYRLFSDHQNGLGYYVGLGFVHSDDYRYTYLNNLADLVVNRPETFDDLKYSLGAEMNSYYLFRGRFELSYYQNMSNTSQSAGSGYNFTLTDGPQFSVDSSISHIISRDVYLGLGVEYFFHAYSFTSNELGPTYQGSVTKTKVDAFLFLGVEL